MKLSVALWCLLGIQATHTDMLKDAQKILVALKEVTVCYDKLINPKANYAERKICFDALFAPRAVKPRNPKYRKRQSNHRRRFWKH